MSVRNLEEIEQKIEEHIYNRPMVNIPLREDELISKGWVEALEWILGDNSND